MITLEIETTPAGYERLMEAFRTGKLTRLAGFEVVDLAPAEARGDLRRDLNDENPNNIDPNPAEGP